MKHADIKSMMAEIAPVIREFTAAAVEPILARLDALERNIAALPVPKEIDEQSIIARAAESMASEMEGIRSAVDAIPEAPELPDIPKMIEEAIAARFDVEDMERSIENVVRQVVAEIPPPKDGEAGPKGEKGDPGVGIDSIDINLIDEGETAVFTFTSGDIERSFEVPLPVGPRGADGAPGETGLKGDPGRDGRDGLDVKDLFRADGGRLMAVLSDGTTKDLGEFVGKNGADGAPGRDGNDGLGFDDMDLVVAEDGAALVFTRGDERKAFALPIVIDRGIYKQGNAYSRGNGVTWGGSFWIAQKETTDKPGEGDGWRLAVKKGRDGRDGTMKPDAPSPKVKV